MRSFSFIPHGSLSSLKRRRKEEFKKKEKRKKFKQTQRNYNIREIQAMPLLNILKKVEKLFFSFFFFFLMKEKLMGEKTSLDSPKQGSET